VGGLSFARITGRPPRAAGNETVLLFFRRGVHLSSPAALPAGASLNLWIVAFFCSC
jgi:hypothetical protein